MGAKSRHLAQQIIVCYMKKHIYNYSDYIIFSFIIWKIKRLLQTLNWMSRYRKYEEKKQCFRCRVGTNRAYSYGSEETLVESALG